MMCNMKNYYNDRDQDIILVIAIIKHKYVFVSGEILCNLYSLFWKEHNNSIKSGKSMHYLTFINMHKL